MPSIVLATLNAKYPHCAFGLRYLLANMGHLKSETALLEFTINQQPLDILDSILASQPRIVGLGVYIWNVEETTRLVADLKRIAPNVVVILGGPEVSYETDQHEMTRLADYVITGEADQAFAKLCNELLTVQEQQANEQLPEKSAKELSPDSVAQLPVRTSFHELLIPTASRGCAKIVNAALPVLNDLSLPYELYSDEDLANRVLYVEASRGCPFTCEFCLSALDIPVRQFPLDQFLSAMQQLLHRGARTFKFVDRTFNLNIRISRAILEFFLERYQTGMFLHFELIPDRLPDALKEVIVRFPPCALQFEVGIQTFNDDVSRLISRQQDNDLVEQNLIWLREHTSVHVHADLIVGLPGESLNSFAEGFDRLVGLKPHEIQVGILKRLRGTPIIRHDEVWQMIYSPHPPYEILQTKLMDFSTIQELRRFARYWDSIANSGNFVDTLPMIWNSVTGSSPFHEFRQLCAWLFANEGHAHGISLSRLVDRVFTFLTTEKKLPPDLVAETMWRDYQRGGRSDKPACLRPYLSSITTSARNTHSTSTTTPKRQQRHSSPTDAP